MAARGRARVGCSGWMYKDWRGVVYPEKLPQRLWFEHYATLFDTVEINNTFYRLPPPSTVEKWAEQAPAGFEYAVKLGGFGSHRMKLRDAVSWLPNHLDRVERLGKSIGPRSCSSRRSGSAMRSVSTSSCRWRRDTCAGRSSSGSRRGSTMRCSRCSASTRPPSV